MKRIIIILALLGSCRYRDSTVKVTLKAYSASDEKPKLLPCICYFGYTMHNEAFIFQDSCSKYDIGDTLPFTHY